MEGAAVVSNAKERAVQHRTACVWFLASLAIGGAAPAQLATPKPGDKPARQSPPAATAPATTSAARADDDRILTARDLLDALERAGDDVRTLQAKVIYDRRFKLQGDRHVRRGSLLFRNDADRSNTPGAGAPGAPRTRTFAILFDELQIDTRLEKSPQTWVFDGRWLVEIRQNEKQFIKREIARPGEPFDPLKIGEGPMPIPIGQKADEIERRYHAELTEPRSGLPGNWNFPAWFDETWQIVLTPRAPDDDEFAVIRLWYEKQSLLPRMAFTVNRGGDESIVFLENVTKNQPLPRERLSVEEPPAGAGWQVQIERLPDLDEGALDAPAR